MKIYRVLGLLLMLAAGVAAVKSVLDHYGLLGTFGYAAVPLVVIVIALGCQIGLSRGHLSQNKQPREPTV